MNNGFFDDMIDEMLQEFSSDIIRVSIKGSAEEATSSTWLGNFAGLDRQRSLQVRALLQRGFQNNTSQAGLKSMLRGIGLSDDDAEVIVSTEYQQMRNRARELAYKMKDKEGTGVYAWQSANDNRVCPICVEIREGSVKGLNIKILKELVKSTARKHGLDGTRTWIAHVGDRCKLVRLKQNTN